MSKHSDQLFNDASSAWDRGDLSQAFALFFEGAESGDDSCQLNLGYFYDCGLHGVRDQRLARHWYYRAYRQGNASAASNIATLHRDAQEYGRMIWWWRVSIRMGNGDALLELGRCYEIGRGLPKNMDRAADCYSRCLASTQTCEESRETAAKRFRHLQRRNPRADQET